MAITDIDISETLETGAPSIKYTGNMDPNMQMASASDAQQEEADKLWKLELKKMELDENYIPEIIDPEEIKVASDPSWESEWEDAYQNYKLKQIELGQEFVSKEEFMEDYQNNMASGGRVKFGLGSILKSVGKAAKKVVKSPIGKAALLGMAGWGIPGTSFKGLIGGGGGGLGSFFGKGSFSPFKAMIGQGTADMGLGPSGLGKLLGSNFVNQATGALTGLGWGAGAVGAGMAAQAFENMKPDDIAALKQNPEALRAYLKQYHSNTNPDKTDEEVDLWVEQNMYSTGGRVGFASGANEKFEEKISALLAKGLSRELAEAIVLSDISPDNFQIIDALENKAEGGRIGYKDAGGVRMASASDPMDDKNQLSLRLFGKPLNSLTEDELIDLDEWMEDKAQKWQGAQGGRIGFAERGTIQDMTISDSPNDPRNMTTIEIISIIKEGRSTPEMFAELRLRGIKGVDEIALAEGQGDVGYSFDERLVDEYNPKTGTAEESFLFKMRRIIQRCMESMKNHKDILKQALPSWIKTILKQALLQNQHG